MNHAAIRPYAAGSVALLGATLIAVVPAIRPSTPNIPTQSPAVELASTADAFDLLANALDSSASTDGLLGIANSLDSFLDTLGNPTVNVADTLASDFVTDLGIGNEVGTIDGDLNAGFALLNSTLTALTTNLEDGLGATGSIDTGLGNIETELTTLGTTLDTDLGSILTALGGLDTINTSINTLDSDVSDLFNGLETTLTNDVGGVSTTLNDLFGNGSEILTLLGYLTYLPGIEAAL
jgi:hypothetical protein